MVKITQNFVTLPFNLVAPDKWLFPWCPTKFSEQISNRIGWLTSCVFVIQQKIPRFLWGSSAATLRAESLRSYSQPIVICRPNTRAIDLAEWSRVKQTSFYLQATRKSLSISFRWRDKYTVEWLNGEFVNQSKHSSSWRGVRHVVCMKRHCTKEVQIRNDSIGFPH